MVVVWPGKSDQDTDTAMDFIEWNDLNSIVAVERRPIPFAGLAKIFSAP
jgi:hypothetical protein